MSDRPVWWILDSLEESIDNLELVYRPFEGTLKARTFAHVHELLMELREKLKDEDSATVKEASDAGNSE